MKNVNDDKFLIPFARFIRNMNTAMCIRFSMNGDYDHDDNNNRSNSNGDEEQK